MGNRYDAGRSRFYSWPVALLLGSLSSSVLAQDRDTVELRCDS